MRASEVVNKKWPYITCMVIVFAWVLIMQTGQQLPYLYTEQAFNIRAFVVFPLWIGMFSWFVWFHRWEESGETGYQMAMSKFRGRRARFKQAFGGGAGLIFISAGLAWTAVYFSAWAANLFASDDFAQAYQIVNKKAASRYLDIEMVDLATGKSASFRSTIIQLSEDYWGVGNTICVRGRTSMFGTIVESTERTEGRYCK